MMGIACVVFWRPGEALWFGENLDIRLRKIKAVCFDRSERSLCPCADIEN